MSLYLQYHNAYNRGLKYLLNETNHSFLLGLLGLGKSTKQLDGTSVAAVLGEVKDHFWGVNSNDVPQTPNL